MLTVILDTSGRTPCAAWRGGIAELSQSWAPCVP